MIDKSADTSVDTDDTVTRWRKYTVGARCRPRILGFVSVEAMVVVTPLVEGYPSGAVPDSQPVAAKDCNAHDAGDDGAAALHTYESRYFHCVDVYGMAIVDCREGGSAEATASSADAKTVSGSIAKCACVCDSRVRRRLRRCILHVDGSSGRGLAHSLRRVARGKPCAHIVRSCDIHATIVCDGATWSTLRSQANVFTGPYDIPARSPSYVITMFDGPPPTQVRGLPFCRTRAWCVVHAHSRRAALWPCVSSPRARVRRLVAAVLLQSSGPSPRAMTFATGDTYSCVLPDAASTETSLEQYTAENVRACSQRLSALSSGCVRLVRRCGSCFTRHVAGGAPSSLAASAR